MAKEVLLMTNLGSPSSTATKDVRKYLNEFLMDERVIDVPKWIRTILVKGIISPFRAGKSAEAYRSIWTEAGSPLIEITKQLRDKVESKLDIPCYISMRYGDPNGKDTLKRIHNDHPDLERLILLPLYPHYAMSSYETAVVQIRQLHIQGGFTSDLRVIAPFYNHPAYLFALADSMKLTLKSKEYDYVLFSYHGIPERHVKKTDPTGNHCLRNGTCCSTSSEAHAYCYRHQIIETTNKVASALQLPEDQYGYSFQSRLGRDPWLQPYTAPLLKEFPSKGIKKLIIICPAFVSDCLETLEEIHEEGKEIFLQAGGEEFTAIPCLNTSDSWIEAIANMVEDQQELCSI